MPCFEVAQLLKALRTDDPNASYVAEGLKHTIFYASSFQNTLVSPYHPFKFKFENGVTFIVLHDGSRLIQTSLAQKRLESITNHFLMEVEKHHSQIIGNFLLCDDTGVVITGESGSGKSLLSLAMIDRGHSLIADDITLFARTSDTLYGYAPSLLSGFIHTRDCPVINLPRVTGEHSVTTHHKIDIIIHLESERKKRQSLATTETTTNIEGIPIDHYQLYHQDLYSSALVIEMLIKDRKSRHDGYNSTVDFHNRQTK